MENIQEYKLRKAIRKYTEGSVSLGKASEIAGVCVEEFKEILKDKGLLMEVSSIPKEELDKQVKFIIK